MAGTSINYLDGVHLKGGGFFSPHCVAEKRGLGISRRREFKRELITKFKVKIYLAESKEENKEHPVQRMAVSNR